MHFSIKRTVFSNYLADVYRAISSKNTIAILKGIKIDVFDDQLTLIASDSEISIKSDIYAQDPSNDLTIGKEGSLVLPARLFYEIVRKLTDNYLTLKQEGSTIIIESGKAVFKLACNDGSDYPLLPEIDESKKITLPSLLFKQMINQTIFAASNQESRPILTGMNFKVGDNHIVGVATDSHRLSKRELPLEHNLNPDDFKNITIPKKTLSELSKIAGDNQEIEMIVSQQQVIFIIGNTTIYSRLLEGDFPKPERLIPLDYQTEIVINTTSFLYALERASLLSREGGANIVQLEYDEDSVVLSVRRNETGNVAEVLETIDVSGNPIKISFNPEYMKDALKSFEEANVRLQFQTSVRPLVLKLQTPSEMEHNDLLQLLTPIRTHS